MPFFVMVAPVLLNSLSAGTDVVRMQRILHVNAANSWVECLLHPPPFLWIFCGINLIFCSVQTHLFATVSPCESDGAGAGELLSLELLSAKKSPT